MDKKKSLDELNDLFDKCKEANKALVSEQRSNILLVSGDHFVGRRKDDNARGFSNTSYDTPRIKIVRNIIYLVNQIIKNNLLKMCPNINVFPELENDMQSQKLSEMHRNVLNRIKKVNNWDELKQNLISDFCVIGETAVKIFWNPNKGEFLGYKEEITQETKEGMVVEKVNKTPQFTGVLEIERLFCMDLKTPDYPKTWNDMPYVCIEKMVSVSELKKQLEGTGLEKEIQETEDKTFHVFDPVAGSYKTEKNQASVREIYYRPCYEYPKGYYYIFTENVKMYEGELPLGKFPIIYCGYDSIPTKARHSSFIKQARPYAIEYLRASSEIVQTQLTIGQDKLLYNSNTKIEAGASFAGIRGIKYLGQTPTVLEGRTGDQFQPYLESIKQELYEILNLQSLQNENTQASDPYASLLMNVNQRKPFVVYAKKLETFFISIFELALELHKEYCSENEVIKILGRNEIINIPEYKQAPNQGYLLKLEATSDDDETLLSKQLFIQNILQYVGGQLEKDDLGKLIKLMPFVNKEELFSDYTIDYDNFVNDCLALERGMFRPAKRGDNHAYYIRKLEARMKKPDFEYLAPQVQELYKMKKDQHIELEGEEMNALKVAQSELIPTSGFGAKADLYTPDSNNPNKLVRVTLPSDSLLWLIERLENQKTTVAKQDLLNPLDQARVISGGDMAIGKSGLQEAQSLNDLTVNNEGFNPNLIG